MGKLQDYAPALSWVTGALGAVGGAISTLLGGWDTGMITLIWAMAIDYITGLIVAGVFHTSPKSSNGALESRAGWKGLCRKGMTLLIVLIAARLDLVLGLSIIRDAVVIAYLANEIISIIENAGLMGVPIPAVIQRAIEVLQIKSDEAAGKVESLDSDS